MSLLSKDEEEGVLKMNLQDLTEEVLIIIFNFLDSCSKANLYYTCSKFRNIICTHSVSKTCCLSLNTLATSKTLKLNFFKDIAPFIQELNLCGMLDLSKTVLVPCLKAMPNIKTLDVSYTNIIIPDILHVIPKGLKNISINLNFRKKAKTKLLLIDIEQCQNIFVNIENVHFVGSETDLVLSDVPMFVLMKSAFLKNVKFTASVNRMTDFTYFPTCEQFFKFHKFSLFLSDWRYRSKIFTSAREEMTFDSDFIKHTPLYKNLKAMSNIEFLLIRGNDFHVEAFVSAGLHDFIKDNFRIKIKCCLQCPFHLMLVRNADSFIKFWNREIVNFDKLFFDNLLQEIKDYFPNFMDDLLYDSDTISNPFTNYFRITCEMGQQLVTPPKQYAKLPRIANNGTVLDFSNLFENYKSESFAINLTFEGLRMEIKLSPKSACLSKLIFLNLTGSGLYSFDFFTSLFISCVNLSTLVVDFSNSVPQSLYLMRALPYAQNLKNFMLCDQRIPFRLLSESMINCLNLESVYIRDTRSDNHVDIINNDIHLFVEKCQKLYSLIIYVKMSDIMAFRLLRLLNKTKQTVNKYYLNIEIYNGFRSTNIRYDQSYDPYVNVFNLSAIKHL